MPSITHLVIILTKNVLNLAKRQKILSVIGRYLRLHGNLVVKYIFDIRNKSVTGKRALLDMCTNELASLCG